MVALFPQSRLSDFGPWWQNTANKRPDNRHDRPRSEGPHNRPGKLLRLGKTIRIPTAGIPDSSIASCEHLVIGVALAPPHADRPPSEPPRIQKMVGSGVRLREGPSAARTCCGSGAGQNLPYVPKSMEISRCVVQSFLHCWQSRWLQAVRPTPVRLACLTNCVTEAVTAAAIPGASPLADASRPVVAKHPASPLAVAKLTLVVTVAAAADRNVVDC